MFLKRKHRKIIYLVIGLVLFAYQTWVVSQKNTDTFPTNTLAIVPVNPNQLEKAKVEKIIDGDTIELTTGQKVRYIGVNTPETRHPQKGVECFGKEAKERNKELLEGKDIYMKKDISETDRYGRLLRFIYLPKPNATNEALFVNQYLVEQGYAYTISYPPDISKNEVFRQNQQFAETNNLGLWKECENE